MEQTKRVNFFSIGIVRGTIGFIVGWGIGLGLTSLIRLAMHLPSTQPSMYGISQPAWVTGALFGAFGFMLVHGVLNDWLKEARGDYVPDHPQDAFPSGWARYLSASYDHKAIGIQYGVTSLLVLLLAGLFALIFRTQLALNQDILGMRNYNTVMTL